MNESTYEKISKNNGITLIALVVTIIVLIILTGISINLLLGENGIITKAKEAKESAKVSELGEKLELVKSGLFIEKEGNIVKVDDYLEEVQKDNKVDFTINEIDRVDEDNAYITVDDDYVFIIKNEDNNIEIVYQGKKNKIKPRIVNVQLDNTTNSVIAKVEAKRAESYKFYIKDSVESNYEFKGENKTGEFEYTNLIQNKKYYIKIEAINNNGLVETEKEKSTGIVAESKGNVTFGEVIWNNGKASATISTKTNYEIEYQVNNTSGTWTKVINGGTIYNLLHNDKVYAKLVDSTNQSGKEYATLTIEDNTDPSANIEFSGEKTQTSSTIVVNAKITQVDTQSGIAVSSCKYQLNTSDSELGTTASNYTTGIFSSDEQTITINPTGTGNWYLHVLTIDNSGKAKETVKGPIKVTANYHKHTGSSSSKGGCYTVANTTKRSCGGPIVTDVSNGTAYTHCQWCGQSYSRDRHGGTCGNQRTITTYSIGCGYTEGQVVGATVEF